MTTHAQYIDHMRERGRHIIRYECPSCEQPINTLCGEYGQKWDTIAICPHCNTLHLKVTHFDQAYAYTVRRK